MRGTALLLFLCAFVVRGQELRFQHLTTEDGLSDNAITCLYEDADGTLLIGTETGLDRFDGTTVQAVEGVHDQVTAITRDRQGVLWVATFRSGLVRIDHEDPPQVFAPNDPVPGALAVGQLTAVQDLDDTTLLIGSRETALIFLDKRSFRFSYWAGGGSISPALSVAHPERGDSWCHGIIALDEHHLWIGLLHNQTSLIVDRRSGRMRRLALPSTGVESYTTSVRMGDRLVLGGWQNRIDTLNDPDGLSDGDVMRSLTGIAVPDEALSLLAWDERKVLAGTRLSGLCIVDLITGVQQRFMHQRADRASVPSDQIRCLFKSRDGVLWVGTPLGLAYYEPDNWRMRVADLWEDLPGEAPDLVFHRMEPLPAGGARIFTSEGAITWNGDGAPVTIERIRQDGFNLQATVMAHDHDGTPLLGTEYGIFRQRSGAWSTEGKLPQHARTGRMYQVRAIHTDTLQGRPVWLFSTLGYGVNVIDARTGADLGLAMPKGMVTRVDRFLVNDAVHAADGTYWFATNGGLGRWRPRDGLFTGDPAAIPKADGNEGMFLPEENVRQVLFARDTVWALTAAGAVYAVVGDRREPALKPAAGVHARGFARDRMGRFWITTNEGLLRGEAFKEATVRIPINDDLDFRKLTRAITLLDDGRIALCAGHHLIAFHPEAIGTPPAPPEPFVVGAFVADRRIPLEDGVVELSYRASVIDVALSARQHGGFRPVLFAYRLDGVETAWRTARPDERLHYDGMPAGAHHLLVRVIDVYGRTGPVHRMLRMEVNAPFWLSWWFYALLVLAVSGGIYAWSRHRLSRAMELVAVRDRIAGDLHDEVGSSLSSITIGAQLARQLSGEENARVRELLDRIGEISSESLRGISDIVWSIDPKNDEGEALVKRMRRIANELLESKGIDVSFNVSGGVEELKLPMNARKEILLLYKEAVHNASKYSGASLVQVSMRRRNGSLMMSVKDDGRGFDPALHPDGHGLGSMRRRADQLQADLTFNSAPGLGTIVGVEVNLTRIRD